MIELYTQQEIETMTNNIPSTDCDALVLALRLAITAPTESQAQQCVAMAETIAARLSEIEVQRAKKEAASEC